jgi:Na+-translocating ferredoxin:NAD+ oxidoreductase RnfA subunit
VVVIGTSSLVELGLNRFSKWTPARPSFLLLMVGSGGAFGVALLSEVRTHELTQAVTLGIGAGAGFAVMLIAFAALYERLRHADIPVVLRDAPTTLITAGILALALMGFSGLIQE